MLNMELGSQITSRESGKGRRKGKKRRNSANWDEGPEQERERGGGGLGHTSHQYDDERAHGPATLLATQSEVFMPQTDTK